MAYGFIAGIISYIIINGSVYLINLVQVRAVVGAARGPAGDAPWGPAAATAAPGGSSAPTALPSPHTLNPPPTPLFLHPTTPAPQAYCFPPRDGGEKPSLARANTWKIARAMTFSLHDGEQLDGSSDGSEGVKKEAHNHPHMVPEAPAPAPDAPEPADAGAAKV